MRAFLLFGLFVFSLICSIFLGAEKAYARDTQAGSSAKIINDSLVQNLRCQNLTVNAIYWAIRDDAFKVKRNIPLQNWGFSSGGADIGGCWALSSTQRMFSYLARYNEPTALSSPERTEHVLNMVRRSSPDVVSNDRGTTQSPILKEWPYRQRAVFSLREDALVDSLVLNMQGLWADIAKGYKQKIAGTTVDRNFVADIQVNQANRFFRFGNLGMGLGSGALDREENQKTMQLLMKNLSGKRLTLLNLRVDQFTQHVVMAKFYWVQSNGDIRIVVYDSNQWMTDHEVIYKVSERQFYAPDIMGSLGGNGPLGVFIVSEEEREDLETAMLKHYQRQCL
ncbi:hypothetical protein [Bdellovibrio svalbardensis]|uniref:Cysteine protease n=1 Tax=Bdellovibrio svalbardensis TaxID=2972972 RepID=A0ABT6DJP0_9BACT|nr:hypothetical protein [Bdellovibrio svalbardensis]MDG0816139.1 hypothetical protein [Bdellovibrio svalbardensis]